MRDVPVAFLILLASACSAQSSTIWTCSYPDREDPPPIAVRFREDGTQLVQLISGRRYQILRNDANGLVAALADQATGLAYAEVTINILAIDKRTMKLNGTILRLPDYIPKSYQGSCLKN